MATPRSATPITPDSGTGALDPADLIASIALFAALDRRVLAKLAVSFDTVTYVEGEAACVQGDPGDSLFIVRQGTLGVFVSTGDSMGARVRTLGPGDYFGEMSLIRGREPRSATVRAEGPCELLRLDRKRFADIAGKEPSVGLALAAMLASRLDYTSRAVAEKEQMIGRRLDIALEKVAPERRPRLYPATLLDEPTAALLRAIHGAAVDDVGSDLAEVDALGGPAAPLVRDMLRERLQRDLGRTRTYELGAVAAAALERAGFVSEALSVLARVGATRELAAALGRSLRTVPPLADAEVFRWIDRVGDEDARLDPVLAQARARILESRGEHARARLLSSTATSRSSLAEMVKRRSGKGKLAVGSLLALLAAAALSAGAVALRSTPQTAFALLLGAAIVLWISEAVPEFAVSLGLLSGWMVLGIATPSQALSGFGSSQWMFGLAILSIAGSISHSGLLFRMGLFLARRMPKGLFWQAFTLLVTGVALTPLLPSSTARSALTTPLALSVVDAGRHEDRGPAAAVLGQAAWIGANPLLFLFLNGSTSCLMAWGLLPHGSQQRFGWFTWFVAALPLAAMVSVGSLAVIFLLLRPPPGPALSQARLGLQQRILGPPSRRELFLGGILLLTVAGWALSAQLHLDPGVVALLAALASVVTAGLDRKAIGELDWAFLMSFGVVLAMADLTTGLGLDKVAGAEIGALMAKIGANSPVSAVLTISALSLAARLLVPPNQSILILGLALIPLAPSLHLEPWVVMMVLLATSQTWFFPSQNLAYMVAYSTSEGRLFTHAQARNVCFAYTGVTLLALLASIPYWRMLGLL
jgi:CRP-like cAMP-binding protein/di/tricarboxylate transporter